jgi:signal transduction histidine kinase
MTIDHNESTRHYLLSTSQLTAGQTTVGQAIVFNEVTQLEEQRQEIQKQSSQLDDFAEAISHELRNAVNILDGRINLARSELAAGDPQSSTETLATASRMADRMTRLISDLTTMARYGRPAEEQSPVNIRGVAVPAFESAGGDANNISVDAGSVESNEVRLERLFDRLFQFFLLRGGTRVSITQADGELTIVGDSDPIEQQQVEAAFAYGQAVPDAETGILLPVARTLAEGLRWEMTVDPDYQQGVRIIITMEPT